MYGCSYAPATSASEADMSAVLGRLSEKECVSLRSSPLRNWKHSAMVDAAGEFSGDRRIVVVVVLQVSLLWACLNSMLFEGIVAECQHVVEVSTATHFEEYAAAGLMP
jgi:hypothetical protein